MSKLGSEWRAALRPDAQAFDEIHITTVPRYKTSGLSGDEWRISAQIQFKRKGQVIHTEHVRNVEVAAGMLYGFLMHAQDNGHGYFGGHESGKCDQEGCDAHATVFYQLKQEFGRNGHTIPIEYTKLFRAFCADHARRGDCGLEDADANYIKLEGPPK